MTRLHVRVHLTRRRLAGLLLAAFLTFLGWGLVAPQTATAMCAPGVSNGTDPPAPNAPGTGIFSLLETPPKQIPPKEAEDQAFKPGSRYTIRDVYGYAGLRWNTYDLGCGGDLADPVSAAENAAANFMMMFPAAMVSITGTLLGAAFDPGFLHIFDPMVSSVVVGMRDSVLLGWLPVAGMALGSLILMKARKNAVSDTASAVLGAGAVLVACALLFNAPLLLGQTADKVVSFVNTTTVAGVNGKPAGVGATSASGELESDLHQSLLYQSWLGGEMGRGHGAIADKYGPDLFKAQALSWREAAIVAKDPDGEGAAIIDDKNTLWDSTTQHIKDEDPDAYRYLTGHVAEQRMGYAFLAGVGVGVGVPFLFFAALLVVVSLIIVRFAVMVFPAIAPIAILPGTRFLATGIRDAVVAAIVNSAVFVLMAALMIKAYGFVLAPQADINGVLQIFIMLALTYVTWRVLRPFRRLTAMVGKQNHFAVAAGAPAEATRATGKALWGLAKTAATAYLAGRVGGEAAAAALADNDTPTRAEAAQPVGDVPQPPGPGTYRPALTTGPVSGTPYKTAGDLPQHPSGVGGYTPPPGPSTPVVPVQDNDGSEVYTIYSPSQPQVWHGPADATGGAYDPRTARAHGRGGDSGSLPDPATTTPGADAASAEPPGPGLEAYLRDTPRGDDE